MTLYLIRHLPTIWNQKGLLQGKKNISISEPTTETLDQIQKNQKLINIDFDEILISSLNRTKETAVLYGFNKENCSVEPLINELDFGQYEGVPKKQLLLDLGEVWFNKASTISLGETMIEFENRLRLFLEKYENKTILAFSHGAIIRGLIAVLRTNSIDTMNTIEIANNELIIIK